MLSAGGWASGLLALIATLVLAPVALAADRLALVIGNDAYRHAPALTNARNDARLMAELLREAQFDVTVVEDVDRTRFWRAVDTLRARIRKGDEVVIYFAGHGVQIGSDPVLLPVDLAAENEAQVLREGVPLVRLQDAVSDARLGLLIIDACRNNPFPQRGTRSIGGAGGLAPIEVAEGMAILMSAGRNQTALDSVPGRGAGHGLFTYSLVQTLRNPGLGVRAALLEARDRVESEARRVGHAQRPALVDEMRGDFRLFPHASTAAVAAAALPARAAAQPTDAGRTRDEGRPDDRRPVPGAGPGTVAGNAVAGLARRPSGPPRKVQLVWEGEVPGRAAALTEAESAELEAAFVQGLQAAGVPLTLPAAPESSLNKKIGAAATNASHLLIVSVVADARSPIGAGFQVSLRSTAAHDLVLSRYTLAQPSPTAPERKFKFVPGDGGFRKVEITEPVVVRPSDYGRTLAHELRDAVQKVLQ